MKKLLAIAAMAVMLCLAGLVMSGEAQAQRFVDNGNGTVTDTATNLMWTKNANPFGRLNWYDATASCSSFSISGIGGWRLPNKYELKNLSDAIRGEHPFTGVQSSSYWSSTSYADKPFVYAWAADMLSGRVYTGIKSGTYHVWPVRAGQ